MLSEEAGQVPRLRRKQRGRWNHLLTYGPGGAVPEDNSELHLRVLLLNSTPQRSHSLCTKQHPGSNPISQKNQSLDMFLKICRTPALLHLLADSLIYASLLWIGAVGILDLLIADTMYFLGRPYVKSSTGIQEMLNNNVNEKNFLSQ